MSILTDVKSECVSKKVVVEPGKSVGTVCTNAARRVFQSAMLAWYMRTVPASYV